ncbi:MAG: nitrilase-related carbon-nitrogen hydrolase [Hyphomicrobiaceae bacterium]
MADRGPRPGDVQLVVWPEAAMPFRPLELPAVLEALGRVIPKGGYLASGVLRVGAVPEQGAGRRPPVFNSIAVLGDGGKIVQVYDKIHLVPFGEYLPMQQTLEAIGLEQLTRIRGGFDIGITPRPLLKVAGLPPSGR